MKTVNKINPLKQERGLGRTSNWGENLGLPRGSEEMIILAEKVN
ncbi:MAG: hypothetical protein Q7S92_02475 [Candidatus Diapherotrites archaeon]|nr:hypothetical protein [Candidatus Diapherotrites archaeon]